MTETEIKFEKYDYLETLVCELIEGGVDRIALNKTLEILRADEDPLKEMERLKNFWWEIDSEELEIKLQDLSTMSPAELDAVQWCDECRDCRARAWIDLNEDFMVLDHVWLQAVPNDEGIFCIGCFETRLGRQLTRADFGVPDGWQPTNKLSARLMDRLTQVSSS